jgi:hypothetical protein
VYVASRYPSLCVPRAFCLVWDIIVAKGTEKQLTLL